MIVVMRDLGQYKYDVGEFYKDFIDYATACFLLEGDRPLAELLKNKYGKQYDVLPRMYAAWIHIMNERIPDDGSWFDALGELYEYLASQSKKSWLGQFFTPQPVCDLMTGLMYGSEPIKGKKVNDPACGSGRTLLSFNAVNPGNYMFAEDLDPICAKMAALNMAIHGCQGQVTCMNTISQEFKWCYEINPLHRFGSGPIPHLAPVKKENCFALLKKPSPEPQADPEPVQPLLFDLQPAQNVANSSNQTITTARPKKQSTPMAGQLTIF